VTVWLFNSSRKEPGKLGREAAAAPFHSSRQPQPPPSIQPVHPSIRQPLLLSTFTRFHSIHHSFHYQQNPNSQPQFLHQKFGIAPEGQICPNFRLTSYKLQPTQNSNLLPAVL
jgi:hypothetical protein